MTDLSPTILRRHSFISEELQESAATKAKIIGHCSDAIVKAVDAIIAALKDRKKILLCGNGGSAADCQHIATEFVIRMSPVLKRPGIPAIALTTDSSLLTAGANDLGYDHVFTRSIETLGTQGDVLIGITTSGKSESVNSAFRAAGKLGLCTIGFLGRDGGNAIDLVDIPIVIPSENTQRIQEGHITVGHIICALVEQELYG
ncbi:MAG: SIS domain-containing protein [Ignavibacteria bacterium]|nr:SIS domain-containing protein [Ignavibacteria bacterium]